MALSDAPRIAFGLSVYAYLFFYATPCFFSWSTNLSNYARTAAQQHPARAALELFASLFPYAIDGPCTPPVPEAAADYCSEAATVPAISAALGWNIFLVAAWAFAHSLLARPAVKHVMRAVIPKTWERQVFVLQACVLLHVIAKFWVPMPYILFDVSHIDALAWMLHATAAFGFIMMTYSSFFVSHTDLFGLRQTFMGPSYTPPGLAEHGAYKYLRHPLYFFTLMTFVSTPTLTFGRALHALLHLAYIQVGYRLEEATLAHELGPSYCIYRKSVPPHPAPHAIQGHRARGMPTCKWASLATAEVRAFSANGGSIKKE